MNQCLERNIPCGCNPQVIAILNANDGLLKTRGSTSSITSHSSAASISSTQKEPELDSEKAVENLLPILQDCGIPVIPVVNKGVRYLLQLLEILKEKKEKQELPESIKLVMFISTTHGRCDEICMNEVYYKIADLVQQLTSIDFPSFFAIFDGCQIQEKMFSDTITIRKVNKPYIAVYTAPPQESAYHQHGVSVLMKCLGELLKSSYKKSLLDFIEDLRIQPGRRVEDHSWG